MGLQLHKPIGQIEKQGFSFVGTTICYAFMQAVCILKNHTTDFICYESSSLVTKK